MLDRANRLRRHTNIYSIVVLKVVPRDSLTQESRRGSVFSVSLDIVHCCGFLGNLPWRQTLPMSVHVQGSSMIACATAD